jgi:6-phosphogluconolactonase (cycloisomerase 2 family)
LAVLSTAAAARNKGGTYLYLHDDGTPNRVWSYRFNNDGTLDPVANTPTDAQNSAYAAASACDSSAYSAKRKLLFTAGGSGLSVFRVGADGMLSLVTGSPFAPQAELRSVAVAEIGKKTYVYASEPASDVIHIYGVRSDDTLLHFDDVPILVPSGPTGLRVVKDVIYFGNQGGQVFGCKILKDGTLKGIPGYTQTVGFPVNTVSVDAKGKRYYVPNTQAPEVIGFQLSGKKAKALSGSPFASTVTTASGLGGLASGAGNYVYTLAAANGGTNDVQTFKRDKKGNLTAQTPVLSSGLANLRGGALDPTGKYLVLVDDVTDQLKSFSIDPKTGALTLVDTETAAFGDNHVNGLVFAK